VAELRFYLDENVPVAVAVQLAQRGVDVVTVRELNALGQSDRWHLRNATAGGRVLCTHDVDFIRLAMSGVEHNGIAIASGRRFGVGEWVKALYQLAVTLQAEDFVNRIAYL
jgi:hypothetical protein